MYNEQAIFVPGVGAHDNIGDAVLRRQLLGWLAPLGRLHVYVGRSTQAYDEALRLPDSAVTYRSFGPWMRRGLKAHGSCRISYVFKPGEIQLTLVGMKEHLGVLPLVIRARRHGGRVVRVGAGARDFRAGPKYLMLPGLLLSDLIYWRDPATTEYFERGQTMPDLAFGEGQASSELIAGIRQENERRTLAISMRGDRTAPSENWLACVRTFARDRGLAPVVVAQVREDNTRASQMAEAIGGEALVWSDISHLAQETRVRAAYRRSALVLSDRLHALIMGATEGAAVGALLTTESAKIGRHFDAVRVHNITSVDDGNYERSSAFLHRVADRRQEVVDAVVRARRDLDAVKADVVRTLTVRDR